MSYQVDYPAVLKAHFVPFDPVLYLIFIVFPLGLLMLFAFRKKTGPGLGYLWILLFITALMPVVILLGVSWSAVGSGWRLEEGKLSIKAFVSVTLEPRETRIALVESSGPWRPVRREGGFGTSGLGTGWFKLKNGTKALVFRHLNSPVMVVLESGGRYFILSHPGVEDLYVKLTDLGAIRDEAAFQSGGDQR